MRYLPKADPTRVPGNIPPPRRAQPHERRIFMNVMKIAVFSVLVLAAGAALAQQPQIHTLQVCNATVAHGGAVGKFASRADAAHSGTFHVRLGVKCDPTRG